MPLLNSKISDDLFIFENPAIAKPYQIVENQSPNKNRMKMNMS
jgi:hypothetical protein